jgi:hypothetical protein
VIYDTVFSYLSSTPDVCPFSVSRGEFRTISGEEEGYFGALSANYLSGVIDKDRAILHPDHATSILGALDLGGSSTQVSMHTGGKAGGGLSLALGRVEANDFFVHSYLGFGVEKMAEKYVAYLEQKDALHDACAPPGWISSGEGFKVVGSGNYQECKDTIAAALGLVCGGDDGR